LIRIQTKDETKKTEASATVQLFGYSYHLKTDDVIVKYLDFPLEEFLAYEARYSLGNYILVDLKSKDNQIIRIITSIGYSGGYIFNNNKYLFLSSILSSVLKHLNNKEIHIIEDSLLRYITIPLQFQLPFSTIFRNINRLPPAYIMEVKDGIISRKETYLAVDTSRYIKPSSYGYALDEITGMLSESLMNNKINLMFSGGVDSTSYLLSFNKVIDKSKIRISTVDMDTAWNDTRRAIHVAKKLGFKIDVIDFGTPANSPDVINAIETEFTRDIINPNNPTLAFTDQYARSSDTIISGQNVDAIATVNMKRPQLSFLQHLLKTGDFGFIVNALFWNIQFTDKYISSNLMPYIYSFLIKVFLRRQVKLSITDNGCLHGLLSTGFPFMISNEYYELIKAELTEFFSLIPNNTNIRFIDAFNFFYYNQNCNKLLTNFPAPCGAQVLLPVMSGPMLSYFIHKSRNVHDVISPKKEIRKYIENISGISYSSITNSKLLVNKISLQSSRKQRNTRVKSILLFRNRERLNKRNSSVLQLINDPGTLEKTELIYDNLYGNIDNNGFIDYYNMSQAFRIINLETLLANVLQT